MKKVISLFLCLVMSVSIFSGISLTAYAEVKSGSCGDNVSYTLDTEKGELVISGTGAMKAYLVATNVPWNSNRSDIKTAIIGNGVTTISTLSFYNCANLTNVTIGDSVTTIIPGIFTGCTSLASVTILNPNCQIVEASIVIPDTAVICGYDYSTAYYYADNYGRKFVDIDPVSSVTIKTLPNITTYSIDDYLDLDGLTLEVTRESGTVSTIPYEYPYYYDITDSGYDSQVIGPQTVKLLYRGFEVQFEVTVKEHSFELSVTPPTCTRDGFTTYACSDPGCEYSYDTNITPATGHSYTSVVTLPTCSSPGFTTNTCTVCNHPYISDTTTAPHNFVTVVTAPTCTSKGYTTYTCSACSYTYKGNETATKAHTSKTTTTKAKTGTDGSIVKKCTVCKKTLSTTVISKASSINLSATSYTYDGKTKTPSVTVKDSKGKTLKNGTDYTVSNPSGRKNVGKYTVTITLKGNYSGTIKKTFTIKPKSTSISKLTATSKGFKVTWKKQATQTTGYEIQYSTSSNFSNAKIVNISKNGTTSRTVSKLTGKKKYFVRVRTYRTVSGTKIYSSWSGSKSVTTKK